MKKSKRHIQILQAIEDAGETDPVVEDLAKQLGISESYASRLLSSLENEGLIIRELQKERGYLLNLTPEGKQHLLAHPYTEVGSLSFIEEEKEAVKSHFLKYLDARQAEGDDYPEELTEQDFAFTLGRLWNCVDPLPAEYCDNLGLASGSAYAEAARTIVAEEFWGLIDLNIDD